MNGVEHIIINILMSSSNQDSAGKLKLVLLSSLLLDDLFALLVLRLVFAVCSAVTVHILNALTILIVMSTRQL